MYISYDNISPKSKSWIYILSKNIDKNILLDLNTFLIKICKDWKSHGQTTKASYVISNNRFIILFAEDKNLISGCSIDKSNKELRKKLNQLKIDLLPNSKIGIFKEDKIEFFKKIDLINLIKNKKILLSQNMINTTINNKESFEKKWVLSLKNSWIAKFL